MGSVQDIGAVNGVTVAVAVTDEPWTLGVDALVVSVGGGLGELGGMLVRRIPSFRVEDIELARIPSTRPRIVELDPGAPLRFVVLASPHGETGDVDLNSVGVATRAAVRAADRAGASSVALPLLATGVLGMPHEYVAAVAVPAVVEALQSTRRLRQVVFVGRNSDLPEMIAAQWTPDSAPDTTSLFESEEQPVDGDLAGGVTSDLVPAEPIPLERDRLGVGAYVSMLATVIAERATPTPLSIGVFGEWGSGKSFFIGMLRSEVDELAGSGSSKYCHRVVQIGFNAWHYVDTNLWVSLADVIFRALAEPAPTPEQQRSEHQRALDEKLDSRAELAKANDRAEAEVARLKAKVDQADGDHVTGTRDLLEALSSSTALHERLDRVWQRIGVTDQVEQGRLLSRELRGIHSDVDTVRRLPVDRNGKIALITAAAVLGVSAAAALAVPLIGWLGGMTGVVLGALGSGLLLRARNGLSELRTLSEDLRGGLDRIHDERVREHVAEVIEKLRAAEADHLVAQAQLDEVVAHVGELGRELAELNPSRRMSTFLRDQGDAYTRDLGVVSTLRKDFEQLTALLADWREHPDADPETRPIDRIVLHIDDLDRCEPKQVVQVLEAVHLLLAMDLFVVVVGVDPRWLVGAVRTHYTELLDHPDGTSTPWRVPPEDYLEKIINIPFTLPGMSAGSLGSVLRSMIETEGPRASAPMTSAEPPRATELTIEPRAPLANRAKPTPARPLTPGELDFLDALEPLITTPRAAKRLFNVYRMIRATRDLSEAARFLGDETNPGEFQAVVILLGIVAAAPTLAPAVLGAPRDTDTRGGLIHRDATETWSTFASDLLPRDGHSPVTGALTAEQAEPWQRLHRRLQPITDKVTLPDLTTFQTWTPHIRRFSYTSR